MLREELLDKIEYLYCRGEYEKLIEKCDELLKIDADNPVALNYKAIALYYLKCYDEAMELLDYNLSLHPKNPYVLNNKALVYIAVGEYEKALECAEEGLKYKDFDWLMRNKVEALIHLGRDDEALEYCNSVQIPSYTFNDALVKCCIIEKDSRLEMMEVLYDRGRFDDVIRICDEIGENPKATKYRIMALVRLERNDEAFGCIEKAIEIYPYDYDLYLIRARVSRSLDESIESYEKAFEILGSVNNHRLEVREYVKCLNAKAHMLLFCDNYDEAIGVCRKAVECQAKLV
jgi:superkiller protein 3